jgi:hypothetical protein
LLTRGNAEAWFVCDSLEPDMNLVWDHVKH